MTIDTPAPLTVETWNKQKTALAKDKSLDDKLSKNTSKLTEALKSLDKARSAVDFSLFETKGVASAADAEAALKKLEAQNKGNLKNLHGAIKLAVAAADEFAAAVEKIRKSLQGTSAAVAVAAMGAANAASKAAPAFEQGLTDAADAAEAAFQQIVTKAKSQKAPPGGASGKLNKQQLLLKSRFITAMKLAKNPPPKLTLKFAFAVGKSMSLCYISKDCGAAHEKLLRGMFPKDDVPKVYRPKDAAVVWEQKKLTFVTDAAVPPGVVKKVALTMKSVFKFPVGLRIRTTAGEAEEAEGEDIPDSELNAGEDPKAKAEAAKEYAKRLDGMRGDIAKALKGPNADDVKERMASIKSNGDSKDFDSLAEDLDLLEALLDETPAAPVAQAAAAGGLSVRQLAVARLEWVKTRDLAMNEITRLCKAVADAYRGETAHLPKVREAITRLDGLKGKLKTPLDDALDKALSENDATRRAQYAKAAKDSLKSIRAFIDKDELMQNLDGNEILGDMRVVQPMKDRLSAIEEALG